ncbi:hypothetical protein EYE40_00245 [Glaciihabitans arcticus]|uniref:Uncharacterized protein n=1 Tax=Glaciihabitans arcticus TaxID=2668039 RepID=A0A4Q9GUV3_9MICO|nr:hypothetical protein [Glaciihabitans arcticus]TBN55950.1 hypothetical protein EYE40_00245 [Glaciihabitans arcticus]
MDSAAGTRALVELEDRSPAVLFELFDGSDVHAWPYLRWPLTQSMAEIELGQVAIANPVSMGARLGKLANQLLPNPFSPSRLPRPSPLLFVVAGRTQATVPGGHRNWLTDDFAEDFAGDAAVLQYRLLDRTTPDAERPTLPHTYSFHDAELASDINARLRPLSAAKIAATTDFVRAVYAELDFEVGEGSIRSALKKVLRHQARVAFMRGRYERVLDDAAPRLIVMDGASYGGARAIQVRLAKERGIPVAELQHGWIGSSHGAYNFGAAMRTPELFAYLPDTLLTFGDYWSRSINTPSTTVAIGKPHLDTLAARAEPWESRPRVALVASSTRTPDAMTASTLELRDALPAEWVVRFRPHPSERATVEAIYPGLVGQPRVEIDMSLDVYESLATSRAVFGHSSTVLFEALAFGSPAFVIDSPLADLYTSRDLFGDRISDAGSLRRAVEAVLAHRPVAADRNDLWKTGGVAAFRAFAQAAVSNG